MLFAGDDPDWVTTPGKSAKYPAEQFLTGYGTASTHEKDAAQIAEANARAQLASTIVVNVRSQVVDKLEEQGKKASQYFSSVTQSSTSLQISGVKTETYTKGRNVHALAYVNRSELVRIYTQKRTDLLAQINSIVESAAQDEKSARIESAAAKYLSLFPLYDELNEATCILLVADSKAAVDRALTADGVPTKTEAANKIDQLLAQTIASVDDAARALSYQISKQVKNPIGKVIVAPLTYQDSRMTSSFARYFRQAVETQMQKYAVWDIAQQAKTFVPKSSEIMKELTLESGAHHLVEGSYWEQGDKIKILGRLRDVTSGKVLAGGEVLMETKLLAERNLSPKPENFLSALAEQKEFARDEIVTADIQLDAWTNKGNENLVFSEGEIMKIFVRANRSCHVRILYTFADGTRTLLFNDHFIDEAKANQVVEIPAEFECAPPFGAELMMVCARTTPFPEIKTYERDDVLYLDEKDAGQAAAGVRGFKKKPVGDEAVQQTEKRLVITTLAK
jgi:TolB-like protein